MNYEDEILLEQYVTFGMMEKSEGMDCLRYLLNMREFDSPMFKTDEYLHNELVMVSFKKEEDERVHFSGAYSLINEGEAENRCIIGDMYFKKGKTIVEMLVQRLCVEDGQKEFSVCEMYTPNKDKVSVKRFSSYKVDDTIKNYLDSKYVVNDKKVNEFIEQRLKLSKSK